MALDLKVVVSAVDKASNTLKKVGSSFNDAGKNSSSFLSKLTSLNTVLVGLATGAIAATTVKMVSLADEYKTLSSSFSQLSDGIISDSKKFESAVVLATKGTINKIDVLKNSTKALTLIGKDSFTDFSSQFTKMAELSATAARATGQDMGYMFDSLVTGVSRSSKMILDNLGINVDLQKTYEEYANQIGVAVSNLDDQQKKTALLNGVISQLDETYGNITTTGTTFSESLASLKNSFVDIQIQIGTVLLPILVSLAEKLSLLITEAMPYVQEGMELLKVVFGETFNFIMNVLNNNKELINNTLILIKDNFLLITELIQNLWKLFGGNLTGSTQSFLSIILGNIGKNLNQILSITKFILLLLTGDWKRAFEMISNYVLSAKDFIVNTFNSILNFLRNLGGQIINAITSPWESALNKVRDIANKIKEQALDKINPFHRESPSLVDNVKAGVEQIKSAYGDLSDIGINPVNNMAGQPTDTGAGMGGGGASSIKVVVNVGMYAGSETEKREIAMQLWKSIGQVARSRNQSAEELIQFE